MVNHKVNDLVQLVQRALSDFCALKTFAPKHSKGASQKQHSKQFV